MSDNCKLRTENGNCYEGGIPNDEKQLDLSKQIYDGTAYVKTLCTDVCKSNNGCPLK